MFIFEWWIQIIQFRLLGNIIARVRILDYLQTYDALKKIEALWFHERMEQAQTFRQTLVEIVRNGDLRLVSHELMETTPAVYPTGQKIPSVVFYFEPGENGHGLENGHVRIGLPPPTVLPGMNN